MNERVSVNQLNENIGFHSIRPSGHSWRLSLCGGDAMTAVIALIIGLVIGFIFGVVVIAIGIEDKRQDPDDTDRED